MPLFKNLPIQTRVHRQATLAWPGNPQECRIIDPISHTFNCFVFFNVLISWITGSACRSVSKQRSSNHQLHSQDAESWVHAQTCWFQIPGAINQTSLRNFNSDRLLNHLDFDRSFYNFMPWLNMLAWEIMEPNHGALLSRCWPSVRNDKARKFVLCGRQNPMILLPSEYKTEILLNPAVISRANLQGCIY